MDRLRFKNINGNNFPFWKEYRLDNIANVYQPQTISTNMFSNEGFPVYGANGIIGLYKYYNHENDQVLVSCRGENCGTVNLSSGKAWITGNTMVVNVEGNKNVDKMFLYYQLSYQNLRYLISGSGQPQIVGNAINKHLILLPQKEEQEKIGGFLSSFDKLIQKQKEKIGLLKDLKKGYLQQMFPVKGANVPRIRFERFADAWEQCELKEIIDVNSGRDYKHLKEGEIPVYGTGGYMLSVNEALSYNRNAVGIGRKGTIDKPYILKAPFWTVDTLFYAIPKEGNDLNFVYSLFQNINWEKYDESTGVPSLSKTTINSVSTKKPTLPEQIQIGSFLEKIDKLVTLHQNKFKDIEELKKGYMQRLFAE